MRNWLKTIISLLAVVTMLGVTSSTYGVAAFARQTGLDCTSCHAAAGFPTLNSFGAAFKAGGYVQGNEEKMIGDGEGLSIPEAVNLGVVFKARDEIKLGTDASGAATYSNELQFPDETAVFAGGRIAKNVGFVIELGDAWFNSFKITWVNDIGPVKLGIVPWHTDAFGAGWIFETLSTGAVRNIRLSENRNLVSAGSATGWGGAGEASGLGLYVWHPMGFVAYTAFAPAIGGIAIENGMGHYIRAAVTPSLDFGDIAVGISMKLGSAEDHSGIAEYYSWLHADAQLMLSDIPLTIMVTYASDQTGADTVAASGDGKSTVLTGVVDYAIIENMLNVNVAYKHGISPNQANKIGGSIRYNIATNLRLSLDFHYQMAKDNSAVASVGDIDAETMIMPMISGSW
jgi:hypothetical protein